LKEIGGQFKKKQNRFCVGGGWRGTRVKETHKK